MLALMLASTTADLPLTLLPANMCLIAFGVVVCAIGEANLVVKGLVQQLAALVFEVCCWLLQK